MNLENAMQVIGWLSLIVGLLVTIRQTAKNGQADQVKLENRLTKIESTLDNINQAIVGGQMIARMNEIDNRLKTIEERGCQHAYSCKE